MSSGSRRYKGTAPFLDEPVDRKTFFGRDREVRSLRSLVLAERLVVLFARSGMGKTSLINAGLMQPLRERGYFPMTVRVGEPATKPSRSLIDGALAAAAAAGVDCVGGDEENPWSFFKTAEFWSRSDDLLRPILILDQFEELFTLQTAENRRRFAAELAALVRGRPATDGVAGSGVGGRALDTEPPQLQLVISLREDFLADLQELAAEIPGILQNRFRLGPLTREGAEEAIVGPAELADQAFATAPFTYREEAVGEIIAFLCKQRRGAETIQVDEVDPVQLQLICQYLEEMVRARQAAGQSVEITDKDLGGERRMQRVLESFYERTVGALRPHSLGRAVRRLCEKRLISSSGRRLTEDGEEIHRRFKISRERLQELVDARLLRSEPRLGGTFYELSHDTLVEPILESSRKRRRKRRSLIGVAAGLVLLVPILGLALFFAISLLPSADAPSALPGSVRDEALLAARSADTLPAAFDDYFREMDGGIGETEVAAALSFLSPEEAWEAFNRGRNAWTVWTGGNDRFWDHLAGYTYGAVDLLKTISSHPNLGFGRDNRFEWQGLLNEPCFEQARGPHNERYGLWLDRRLADCPPDPFEDEEKYPGVKIGARGENLLVGSYYGYASGVVGLRLFPNPEFDEVAESRWDPERYYLDPSYYGDADLVRPYRVGMSCAFCHAGPSPTNPPADPNRPAWAGLSATVGNQYVKAARVFLWQDDASSFPYQLLASYRPGTLDSSFVVSDEIVNPRAIEPIQALRPRLDLARRWAPEVLTGGALELYRVQAPAMPEGLLTGLGTQAPLVAIDPKLDVQIWPPRLLKDGADSAGLLSSITRMSIEHGLFSEESLLHFTPFEKRVPLPIEIRAFAENSAYWNATVERAPDMALYLLATGRPPRLESAPGGEAFQPGATLRRGKTVFASECAGCHSSKLPELPDSVASGGWDEYWEWIRSAGFGQKMTELTLADDFLEGNYLSIDRRVPVTLLGANICSALATNAGTGEIWYNFSSQTYRQLPAVGAAVVQHPVTGERMEVEMPAGGRGYTRVPSLLGLWATAPYLLNNSVGEFTGDPSVEGRMASFEDAVGKLLWPEKRELRMDRTTATSYLTIRHEMLRSILGGSTAIGPIPAGTPVGLLASLQLSPAGGAIGERMERANALASLMVKFKNMTKRLPPDSGDEEVERVFSELVGPLLELSACPDFVVNRGHTFGSELSDDDKRALIGFLKTL